MSKKPEEQLQANIVQYWNYIKNTLAKKTLLYSNRNENGKGGINGIIAGRIFKEMGRQAGIPDLTLLTEGGKVVFIELKTKERCITTTGKQTKSLGLSAEQIEMHAQLKSLGFKVYTIWSLEQFETILALDK